MQPYFFTVKLSHPTCLDIKLARLAYHLVTFLIWKWSLLELLV